VLETLFKTPSPTATEESPGVAGSAKPEPSPTITTDQPATQKPSHSPAILHTKEKPEIPPPFPTEPQNSERLLPDVTPTRKE
jgi:hypothetical protein